MAKKKKRPDATQRAVWLWSRQDLLRLCTAVEHLCGAVEELRGMVVRAKRVRRLKPVPTAPTRAHPWDEQPAETAMIPPSLLPETYPAPEDTF